MAAAGSFRLARTVITAKQINTAMVAVGTMIIPTVAAIMILIGFKQAKCVVLAVAAQTTKTTKNRAIAGPTGSSISITVKETCITI